MELLIEFLLAEIIAIALRLAVLQIRSWFRGSSRSPVQLASTRAS